MQIEEKKVVCNMCDFIGLEDNLMEIMDGEELTLVCPTCKTDNYLMDK